MGRERLNFFKFAWEGVVVSEACRRKRLTFGRTGDAHLLSKSSTSTVCSSGQSVSVCRPLEFHRFAYKYTSTIISRQRWKGTSFTQPLSWNCQQFYNSSTPTRSLYTSGIFLISKTEIKFGNKESFTSNQVVRKCWWRSKCFVAVMILVCLCSSGPEFPDTLEETQSISMYQNQRPPPLFGTICLYLNTVINIANATYWVIINKIQGKKTRRTRSVVN